MSYFYCLKVFCLGWLALNCVSAQDAVELRFVSFPKDAQATPLELLIGEGQTIQIEASANRISKSYHVPARDKWTIGRSQVTGKEPAFDCLAETTSLSSRQQLIIILRGEKDGAEDIQLISIDASASGFCGGRYLLFNSSPNLIRGVLGEVDFSLKNLKHAVVEPVGKESLLNKKNASAAVSIYSGESKRPFFSSKWRVNSNARSLIFFYSDPKSEKLRFHSIRDYTRP